MKVPEIAGKNKIRDAWICRLYVQDNLNSDEIADKVSVCASRVRQILYKNRGYLQIDKDWEKIKQVHRIKNQIRKRPDSKKDVADLEELLRKVMDGDKAVIDQSHHLHVTTIQEAIASAGSNNADRRETKSLESARVLEE